MDRKEPSTGGRGIDSGPPARKEETVNSGEKSSCVKGLTVAKTSGDRGFSKQISTTLLVSTKIQSGHNVQAGTEEEVERAPHQPHSLVEAKEIGLDENSPNTVADGGGGVKR